MPITEINGHELHWERAGSGPRLLYCNGSGSTLAEAAPQIALIAGDFDLLSFDYRGLGGASPVTDDYTMADIAADIAGLLDEVGWLTTRVWGVSFGGMVAQEFAVTFPERVERLALLVTSPGGAGGSSYPLHTLAELSPAERAAKSTQLVDSRWTPEYLAAHREQRLMIEAEQARMAAPKPASDEQAFAAQLRARSAFDAWDRLPRISCPTLVAAGRYDGIAPAANGEAVASQITGARFQLYEGGHPLLFQDPKLQRDLRAFLLDA